MIAFPKLLYLFQTLPLYLRPKDEKLLNRTFRTFIWQGKRPRIALHILQQHKLHGGINFPDIRLYNLSANLRILKDWLMGTSAYSPTTLEGQIYPTTSLTNLLHLPYTTLPTEMKSNPLFMATWRTWVMSRRRLELSANASVSLSFVRNPLFQNGRAHPIIQQWANMGLSRVGDLLDTAKQTALTFNQACIKYDFLKSHFFHFLQVQSYVVKTSRFFSTQDWDDLQTSTFRGLARADIQFLWVSALPT